MGGGWTLALTPPGYASDKLYRVRRKQVHRVQRVEKNLRWGAVAREPFFNRGQRSKIKFYHVANTLIFNPPAQIVLIINAI